MTPERTKELYQTNEEFRQYVDRFFRIHKVRFDDGAFKLKIIQTVAEEYDQKH